LSRKSQRLRVPHTRLARTVLDHLEKRSENEPSVQHRPEDEIPTSPDGTDLRPITRTNLWDSAPDWGPAS